MGSYSRKRYATESASFPKSASSAPGSYSYATFADLPASGSTPGNTAFVVATNKLYIWSGVGWYLIATVTNVSPTAISGVNGSYSLAIDGTATTITAVSTDPEGFPLTWSYAVSSGSLGSTATVAQADNVFTITPSTNTANAGTFSLTFSVTDGLNGVVSSVSAFTLSFFVINSRYTALSVKATATGSNQTFDDASTSNHTITTNGDVAASTFSPYRHGGYSAYFDGTGDWLTVNGGSDFSFGTGDFTIECWYTANTTGNTVNLYQTSTSTDGISIVYTDSLALGYESSKWTIYANGGYYQTTNGAAPVVGQWQHTALVRNSGTLKLYLSGVEIWSQSDATNYAHTHMGIGGRYDTAFLHQGFMSDVRVVKGTAVYTSAFTPPAGPVTAITNTKFLLGDLPYFKDQSASNHAIAVNGDPSLKPESLFDNAPYSEASHGASVKIESSGSNRLTSPITAMGTGDFTVSGWVYTIGSNNPDIIFDTRPIASDGSTGFYFAQYNAGYFYVGTAGNNFGPIQGTTNYPKNAWNHFAIVRDSSGNLKMYINGNLEGTDAIGTSKDLTSTDITIGSNRAGSSTCNAYVSDLRIVHSVLYTTTFTPPTAPLTAITNTKFLLNPEPSISDLSQKSTITCFGNTATSTTQVKFLNTRSIYGDGSGDYVSMPIDPIGTDDFTVEAWIYPTSMGSYATAMSGATINGAMGVVMRVDQWFIGNNSTSQTFTSAANKFVINQWQHIAMTRQGTSVKLFYNGTQFDSGTNSTNLNQTKYVLFAAYTDGSYLSFAGHIQDFRITKGLARYTANFTPPTAELQG